ncbi:hypothetical protein [Saccharopolyspora hattusasensis]
MHIPRDDQPEVTGPPILTPIETDPVATGVGSEVDQNESDTDG